MDGKCILFICTGNYYRSRFAEEVFNYLAERGGSQLRATSLGLFPSEEINPGTLSKHARSALEERGISPLGAQRDPSEITAADFERFETIIALSEREHRPMIREAFPLWENRVVYWAVEDVALEAPRKATECIYRLVLELIAEKTAN